MKTGKKDGHIAAGQMLLFGIWTALVRTVNVCPAGETNTEIGFANVNGWFHEWTGVHMGIYRVTDWLSIVPVAVCLYFAFVGAKQLFARKSLRKVDRDLILLGAYYLLVIGAYLLFEQFPVNYRPVFLEGRMEASYPSSTTLLVLSVMPTLAFQARRRACLPKTTGTLAALFSAAMVIGRLFCGVHWLTDIVGAVFLSSGLFAGYRAAVQRWCDDGNDREG